MLAVCFSITHFIRRLWPVGDVPPYTLRDCGFKSDVGDCVASENVGKWASESKKFHARGDRATNSIPFGPPSNRLPLRGVLDVCH